MGFFSKKKTTMADFRFLRAHFFLVHPEVRCLDRMLGGIIISSSWQVGQVEHLTSQAVGVSSKSVARIENNYIYKTGTGVSVLNSDVTCSR